MPHHDCHIPNMGVFLQPLLSLSQRFLSKFLFLSLFTLIFFLLDYFQVPPLFEILGSALRQKGLLPKKLHPGCRQCFLPALLPARPWGLFPRHRQGQQSCEQCGTRLNPATGA